ncbi:MAG: hypothetical protein PHQ65_15375, partial [Bacteroidales bacterium]|nr:hypothetical protein [Bacteroidales bacterium]
KINLVLAAPANCYYVDIIEVLPVCAIEYPNPDPNDPHAYLMYQGSGFSECIEWEDMNFYLSGTKNILLTQLRPAGKLLISYDIIEEIFGGSWYMHAIEDISYGTPVSRPPGGSEDL